MSYNEEKIDSSEVMENNNQRDGGITHQKETIKLEETSDDISPPVILLMNFPQIDSQEKSLKFDPSSTDTRSSSLEFELNDLNSQAKNIFIEK